MRDSYQATSDSYGMVPIILLTLCFMAGMAGYLVAFAETFRASPTPRIYIADIPELYGQPVANR
ncbi:hypothetical protein AAIH70_16090 [Neorhizobium sp. BT27B]|uniref:hypothetical protein n=1 Tax=Neorhizobium sp. BT27B TaxID=3142625 RepID=UPI003D2DC1C2